MKKENTDILKSVRIDPEYFDKTVSNFKKWAADPDLSVETYSDGENQSSSLFEYLAVRSFP